MTDLRPPSLDWSGPDIVGSFQSALDSRPWADEAACAAPAYRDLTWVVDIHNGTETTGSVVSRFEVCAACPVREPCLLEAMTEMRWSVMGCWGGTVMTERTAAIEQARIAFPERTAMQHRLTAAQALSATLEARTEAWRKRQAKRRPLALIHTEPPLGCSRCGQGWLFDLPPARCSRVCQRISRLENRNLEAA